MAVTFMVPAASFTLIHTYICRHTQAFAVHPEGPLILPDSLRFLLVANENQIPSKHESTVPTTDPRLSI